MRTIAIPIYAFMISGFIHPTVARWIWGGGSNSTSFFTSNFLSPYRKLYCRDSNHFYAEDDANQTGSNIYVLDFAGGGAVHLLGGVAGLVLLLVLKLDNFLRRKDMQKQRQISRLIPSNEREQPSKPDHFLDWMYPEHGGGDLHIEDSALGVLILWTTWFAFNCGSTESVESTALAKGNSKDEYDWMYYNVPGRIAMNMILCTGSAGLVAVCIAGYAQLRSRSPSTNVNEIANGILSALVSITSSCPFVTPGWAIGIGIIAVLFYHFGCWIEYKFNLDDTARVFPVHGVCGFWSMMAPGILVEQNFVEQTYGGLCYCRLLLPKVSHGYRFLYQLLGSVVIALWSALSCGALFLLLNFIPTQKLVTAISKCLCIYKTNSPQAPALVFKRGLLFTCPDEYVDHVDLDESGDDNSSSGRYLETSPLLSTQAGDGDGDELDGATTQKTDKRTSLPMRGTFYATMPRSTPEDTLAKNTV